MNENINYPSSDERITIPSMKVQPLKKICMTIGQLPTAYIETMSYYEMLIWFIEFLRNTVIPTVNNNGEALQEVQNIVMELQNYINDYKDTIDEEIKNFENHTDETIQNFETEINNTISQFETTVNSTVQGLEDYMNNYFNNLDVQEEINNKLDQMLEDGILEEIIDQFIQTNALWCFNTIADLKNATNLINGSFAKTLGYYNINDGGQGVYKIRTRQSSDIPNDGNIVEINQNLIGELITNDYVTPEQFGAYGDEIHDDTTPFTNALKMNKPILLKDNSTYNIIKIYTSLIPNIIIYANNKANIKWNITSTEQIADFEGMITDDNPNETIDPNGGYILLKNINFNGNGDNIQSFPNTGNFGLFHLKNRNIVKVENCKFEKIHCNGINLRGYEKCNIVNSNFEYIGLYQNVTGTRNGLTITREYASRIDGTSKSITSTPMTKIENCKFSHISDECVRIDGCSNFEFINNSCDNIGQHIVESGHNSDDSNYNVLISNINANKIGQAVYSFGADGGGSWSHTGNILVENSKFHNMCYEDDFSQFKRSARPFIIPGYVSNYNTYAPNIDIINCEFISINDTITYQANQKMIFGKNVNVKDSIFNYYNTAGSVPMFQGVNVNLNNVKYKITSQVGSKFLINGLGGNINLYNSIFEVERLNYIIDVNNCKTYIENCEFYENTDSTGYTYMITIKSNADYNSSISMINSKLVNKNGDGTSTNSYIFTVTEGNIDYKLDIMRLIGNYFKFSNINNKSYAGGSSETYNLLINVNNSQYNAS